MMNNRYSGKNYVGSGGMASVYRAFDEVLRRSVAIKELTEQLRGNRDVRSLFLSEARKMAAVRHQNVVQVYDVSDDDGVPTIIMEYLEGGSIASKLGRGPLTPDEVIAILRQVTQGLKAIHEAGLVHRDVKPENIIEDGGTYKIADFGVAMSGDEEALPFVTNKYAAPEVLLEPEKIGPASDVYSLGIMAAEMLLGSQRFEDVVREAIETDTRLQLPAIRDSAQAFWQQWVASSVELPPLHTLEPAVSPELSHLLTDMSRREQVARIGACQVILDRLAEVERLSGRRAEAPTEYSAKMHRRMEKVKAGRVAKEAESPLTAKRKKPLWFKATVGLGVFLLVAVGVLLMLPAGPPRFYLEVSTTPPGASVTVNGQLLENDPTPTWFNAAWGDTVLFQLGGQEPIEIVMSETMEGLAPIENGYRLDLGWAQPDWIDTSAEAAAVLRDRLPAAWPLRVSLETPGSRQLEDGSYSVTLGTDLNFTVTTEQSASIAVVHLGSNDVVTLIYPNPLGFAPRLDADATGGIGQEIGLVAQEPLGTEWFVFVAADALQLPPPVPGSQAVGNWAAIYPFGEQGAPGESLVNWLVEAFAGGHFAATVVQLEVVGEEVSE